MTDQQSNSIERSWQPVLKRVFNAPISTRAPRAIEPHRRLFRAPSPLPVASGTDGGGSVIVTLIE